MIEDNLLLSVRKPLLSFTQRVSNSTANIFPLQTHYYDQTHGYYFFLIVLILLILVNCSDGSDSGSEVDSNHSSPQIVHLSMVCAFSRYDPMLDTVPY